MQRIRDYHRGCKRCGNSRAMTRPSPVPINGQNPPICAMCREEVIEQHVKSKTSK
jgi:hypothetical protein